MKNTIFGIVFLGLVLVIILMGLNIHHSNTVCKEDRIHDQQLIKDAARKYLQSTTETHAVLAYKNAMEAQFVLDSVMKRYGGPFSTEKALALEKKRMNVLVQRVQKRVEDLDDLFMKHLSSQDDRYAMDVHADAGLVKRRKNTSAASTDP